MIAASLDTFCLVAPQPQEIQKEVQLHLTTRAFQWAIKQGSSDILLIEIILVIVIVSFCLIILVVI